MKRCRTLIEGFQIVSSCQVRIRVETQKTVSFGKIWEKPFPMGFFGVLNSFMRKPVRSGVSVTFLGHIFAVYILYLI